MASVKWLTLCLFAFVAMAGCKAESTDTKKEEPKKEAKAEPKAEEPKAEEPKAEEPKAEAAVPALSERDFTEEAKTNIPSFAGKLTALAPENAAIQPTPGGFGIRAEGFSMTILVAAYHAKEVKARVDAGEGFVKNPKVVDSGDDWLLYEGDVFGDHAFHAVVDLPAITGLKAGCGTPTGEGLTRPQAENVIAACRSVKVE